MSGVFSGFSGAYKAVASVFGLTDQPSPSVNTKAPAAPTTSAADVQANAQADLVEAERRRRMSGAYTNLTGGGLGQANTAKPTLG